jgi:hypothetical protein
VLVRSGDLVSDSPATSLLLDARYWRVGRLCEICRNVQRSRKTDRRAAKLDFINEQREDRDVEEILGLEPRLSASFDIDGAVP